MAERTLILVLTATPGEALHLLKSTLATQGLQLATYDEGKVYRLNSTGDQVSSSESEIRHILQTEGTASFQWWLDVNHDLYCHIHKSPQMTQIELGMEGADSREIDALRASFMQLWNDDTEAGMVRAFLFDPEGISEDVDWERFLCQSEPPENWPALGFPMELRALLGHLALERIED